MVRLKEEKIANRVYANRMISIPYGAIKSKITFEQHILKD